MFGMNAPEIPGISAGIPASLPTAFGIAPTLRAA